jgi:SAM-dependent methyltransferase
MRRFWDRAARENPFYFVDNRTDYRAPDVDAFWREGQVVLDGLLGDLDVQLRPTDMVVEIGCGVGRMTRVLGARAREVVALDVSERMLELAREYNPELHNVRWLLGDGTSLAGVADASADVCVSHVVFQHIPDPAVTLRYVREMGRVLRAGGWAAFQVSNDPKMHHRRAGIIRQRLLPLLGRAPSGQDRPEWLGSSIELHELRTAAADGGLELSRVRRAGTQWCEVLARKLLSPDAG